MGGEKRGADCGDIDELSFMFARWSACWSVVMCTGSMTSTVALEWGTMIVHGPSSDDVDIPLMGSDDACAAMDRLR